MKRFILFFILLLPLLSGTVRAQRYNGYYEEDDRRISKLKLPPSERGTGFAIRFGLEAGKMEMATINIEYEINPYVAVGLGSGGGYHLDAGWAVPIYVETRAYAPNALHSGYASLRLGYMLGLAGGKEVPTEQTLYGNPLTRVDKMGGFMATFGLGYSWKRLDAGVYFGLAFGSFHKYYIDDKGETFEQWVIPNKAYLLAGVRLSYSLRLWQKEPYNKVIKKN